MPKPGFFLILAVLIAEVLSLIEITMFFAALRVLVEEFGGPDKISWAVTGFLLMSAVSAALLGRLGDMYNRKSLLLVVIAVSVLGSLIAGFSSTLAGVIIGRCVQGVAGGIFPLCIGILRENVDKQRLPVFIGFLSAVMTVSAGLGLYVGGIIIDYLTWHWIFFTTAIVGVIAWLADIWPSPFAMWQRRMPGPTISADSSLPLQSHACCSPSPESTVKAA